MVSTVEVGGFRCGLSDAMLSLADPAKHFSEIGVKNAGFIQPLQFGMGGSLS